MDVMYGLLGIENRILALPIAIWVKCKAWNFATQLNTVEANQLASTNDSKQGPGWANAALVVHASH